MRQSASETYLARMSQMPLAIRKAGAPERISRSQSTSSAAFIGIEHFLPSMMMEQILAVNPSALATVGTHTNGMPS